MKKFFSLAILSMIAVLSFAQAPAMTKKAATKQIQKVMTQAQLEKGMEAKAAYDQKAKAANETSSSVVRRAGKQDGAIEKKDGLGTLTAKSSIIVNARSINVPKVKTTPRKGAPTVDAHGIITAAPADAEVRNYTRGGSGLYYTSQGISYQSGTVVVAVDGNDWYIKDPIAGASQGVWVKGTLSEDGKTLTVAASQPVYYNANYNACMVVSYGDFTGQSFTRNANKTITYSVDGNVLTLNGAEATISGSNVNFTETLGIFWDDDDTWQGYGEWNTVLTYDADYVAPSTDLVELPEGAEVVGWYMNATSVSSTGSTPIQGQNINVAFVGSDVYVQGIFKALFPNSWIKGTIDGQNITFANVQYLGKDSYGDDTWAMGWDATARTLGDFTATYDATAKVITGKVNLLANCDVTRAYYDENYSGITFMAEKPVEEVITDLTAELPYTNSFATAEEKAQAAIYDANGDGKTWKFQSDTKAADGSAARYTYDDNNNGDDYIVFPGLALDKSKIYKVAVKARSNSTYYPERIEVVAGTEAVVSKLNKSVIAPTDLETGAYEDLSANFKPSESGTYYFAIHAISDADNYYLWADDFSVIEVDSNAPQVATNVKATPGAEGAMSATISFRTPSKSVGGSSYTSSTNLGYKVMRGETLVAEGTAKRSTNVTVEDTNADNGLVNGINTWSIIISRTISGTEHISEPALASCWVGEDAPSDVENLTAADKNDHVALTWDAPTEGANGGYVNPANIKYNVYPVDMFEFFGMVFPEIDTENPYATAISETNYNVVMDTNEGEQDYVYFGVTAGEGENETAGVLAAELIGAPYELPFEENVDGGIAYWWGLDYDDATEEAGGGLGIGANNDFQFVGAAGGWVELISGKISLAGASNPGLSFKSMGAPMKVDVYGPTKSMATVAIAATEEYTTQNINLAELVDQPWIRFNITAEFAEDGEAFVDDVVVMELVANDLDVTVKAPSKITAGKAGIVKATVKNVGLETASDYQVKFYVNGEEAPAPLFDIQPLAMFESAEYEFELQTSIFDEADDVTVKAEVVYAADELVENNADEAVISIVLPSVSPVENLAAEETEEGVTLTWTVPENAAAEVVEDFESYDGNTVYANGETCGVWSAVDLSQGSTYSWESGQWDHMGESYAFGIIDIVDEGLDANFSAVSGTKTVLFMSEVNATSQVGQPADKYMISPVLPGVAQTVSFMALPITTQYGAETFEVLASSTDANPASFTKVASFSSLVEDWTEYSAQLPEGTKYFAIHYTSNDIFGLFVDDLTYTTGGATPTGFNIYQDDLQIASVGAEAREYTVPAANLAKANKVIANGHSFAVTAVYDAVESAPVVVKNEDIVNAIKNVNFNNADAEVYTIDGIRVEKATKAGVYVVNGQKVVLK